MAKIKYRRVLMGLLLILIGGFMLIHQFELIEFEMPQYIYSWKMILIVLGVILLLSEKNKITGLILILIGGTFLATDIFDASLREVLQLLLPVILILLGLFLLFKVKAFGSLSQAKTESVDSVDFINETNIFSGSNKIIKSSSFKGGQVNSIFGGSKLDLTECELAKNKAIIEVSVIFGEFAFVVPDDWSVKIDAVAIFGSSSDERVSKNKDLVDPEKLLIIKGAVVFGELKVR